LEMVMIKKIGSQGTALKIEAIVKKMPKFKKEMLVDGKITVTEIMETLNTALKEKRPINILHDNTTAWLQ